MSLRLPYELPQDEVVVAFIGKYDRYLDQLLAAPPTEAELEAERNLVYLDDAAWEALGIAC